MNTLYLLTGAHRHPADYRSEGSVPVFLLVAGWARAGAEAEAGVRRACAGGRPVSTSRLRLVTGTGTCDKCLAGTWGRCLTEFVWLKTLKKSELTHHLGLSYILEHLTTTKTHSLTQKPNYGLCFLEKKNNPIHHPFSIFFYINDE